MYRPHGNQLAQADRVDGVCVPETHGEYAGVVCECDFVVALGGFVSFAGFGNVVEVNDAAC